MVTMKLSNIWLIRLKNSSVFLTDESVWQTHNLAYTQFDPPPKGVISCVILQYTIIQTHKIMHLIESNREKNKLEKQVINLQNDHCCLIGVTCLALIYPRCS